MIRSLVRSPGRPILLLLGTGHGLTQEIVDAWAKALQGVKKDKAWNKFTNSLGSIPQILPPGETQAFAKRQYEVYHELGTKLGLLIK